MQNSFVSHFTDKEQEKTFRYLYEKYVVLLRYFATRYINDQSVISDIVQDAFVRLWEKILQFKDENEAKAFLYKVVQNACIDLIRHQEVAQKYVEHIISENTEEKSFLDNILESEIFQALRARKIKISFTNHFNHRNRHIKIKILLSNQSILRGEF